MASARTRFLRWPAMVLACAVALGACGSRKPSSSTSSVVAPSTAEGTIPGRTLRDWLTGRTFILAKPDGTFPTHHLQPSSTLTFVLDGDGRDSGRFINGIVVCNSVSYVGSLDGDHLVITESATTAVGCPPSWDGMGIFEPLDARLALSDDGSTVTVTASDTGKVAYLLFDPARLPLAQGASLVGTYRLTQKRLLVLDQNGTGRIIDAVSQVTTCPVTWTPPPSLTIAGGDCPPDEELQNSFGPLVAAGGDVRQHDASLFVGSFSFTKTTPAPPSAPASDPLANWPSRPNRTFTMADVPVLLPPDRHGRYSVFDRDIINAVQQGPAVPSGDHFVQYLVNTSNPADLLIVDTSLGRSSLDRVGAPMLAKVWPGAWSDNGVVTLLSETGRVVLTGANARQQIDLLNRRASGAGWDVPAYAPMIEGWRYPLAARSIVIDADDFHASIRVTVGATELPAYELNGPKLRRIEVSGHPASSMENIGTWDVTWSPAPDVIVTVSCSLPGPNFDHDAFEALRPAAEAFAQSLQPATPEELARLVSP